MYTQILYNYNAIMFSTVCISSFRAPGNINLFIQIKSIGFGFPTAGIGAKVWHRAKIFLQFFLQRI